MNQRHPADWLDQRIDAIDTLIWYGSRAAAILIVAVAGWAVLMFAIIAWGM